MYKSLGQSTDWEITEVENLLEIALEECQDDLEGVKDDLEGVKDAASKAKFTRIDKFKLSFKKQVVSDSDETKATKEREDSMYFE